MTTRVLIVAALLPVVAALVTTSNESGSWVGEELQREGELNYRFQPMALIHVPGNFGGCLEKAGMKVNSMQFNSMQSMFLAHNKKLENNYLRTVMGKGAQIWGAMNFDLREINDITKCDTFYTPQKYWSMKLRNKFLTNRKVFGILRDPYDRIVNIFRSEAMGQNHFFQSNTRTAVSFREGTMERESPMYMKWYVTCDVNAWIEAEFARYQDSTTGSRAHFRSNCHLLPQAEYFKGDDSITIPIDARKLPQSFNDVMDANNIDVHLSEPEQASVCPISAWHLTEKSRQLIRDFYREDFELLCKHFGYCDDRELTCMRGIRGMCDGAVEPWNTTKMGWRGQ